MGTRRFRGLAEVEVLGRIVIVASGPRARLLGLALLDRSRAGPGLLIPSCRSVHTFGMRFPIDVLFLDRDGFVLREERAVRPCRILACAGASAVLELPATTSAESAPRVTSLGTQKEKNQT
jgi:uncharacterized membrane protein (UPF0127 family)